MNDKIYNLIREENISQFIAEKDELIKRLFVNKNVLTDDGEKLETIKVLTSKEWENLEFKLEKTNNQEFFDDVTLKILKSFNFLYRSRIIERDYLMSKKGAAEFKIDFNHNLNNIFKNYEFPTGLFMDSNGENEYFSLLFKEMKKRTDIGLKQEVISKLLDIKSIDRKYIYEEISKLEKISDILRIEAPPNSMFFANKELSNIWKGRLRFLYKFFFSDLIINLFNGIPKESYVLRNLKVIDLHKLRIYNQLPVELFNYGASIKMISIENCYLDSAFMLYNDLDWKLVEIIRIVGWTSKTLLSMIENSGKFLRENQQKICYLQNDIDNDLKLNAITIFPISEFPEFNFINLNTTGISRINTDFPINDFTMYVNGYRNALFKFITSKKQRTRTRQNKNEKNEKNRLPNQLPKNSVVVRRFLALVKLLEDYGVEFIISEHNSEESQIGLYDYIYNGGENVKSVEMVFDPENPTEELKKILRKMGIGTESLSSIGEDLTIAIEKFDKSLSKRITINKNLKITDPSCISDATSYRQIFENYINEFIEKTSKETKTRINNLKKQTTYSDRDTDDSVNEEKSEKDIEFFTGLFKNAYLMARRFLRSNKLLDDDEISSYRERLELGDEEQIKFITAIDNLIKGFTNFESKKNKVAEGINKIKKDHPLHDLKEILEDNDKVDLKEILEELEKILKEEELEKTLKEEE